MPCTPPAPGTCFTVTAEEPAPNGVALHEPVLPPVRLVVMAYTYLYSPPPPVRSAPVYSRLELASTKVPAEGALTPFSATLNCALVDVGSAGTL